MSLYIQPQSWKKPIIIQLSIYDITYFRNKTNTHMIRKLILLNSMLVFGISSFAQTMNTHLDSGFLFCSQITQFNSHFPNFPTPTPRNLNRIYVLPDDKILVTGSFTAQFGSDKTYKYLLRLHPDGSIDSSFQFFANTFEANRFGITTQVKQLPNNQLWVGGSFSQVAGTNSSFKGLYKINEDGSNDTSFKSPILTGSAVDISGNPTNTSSSVFSFDVLPNGKIVIAGEFLTVDGDSCSHVAVLNSDGSRYTGFNSPFTSFTGNRSFSVISLPDNKILISTSTNSTLILKENGEIDTPATQALPVFGSSLKLLKQDDGRIYLVGNMFGLSNPPAGTNKIARLNNDLTLDNSFTPLSANRPILNLRELPDGKIFIIGEFSTVSGEDRRRVARLHNDGSLDESFDPGADGFSGTGGTYDAYVQSGGQIVVHHSQTHHQGNVLSNSNAPCFVMRLKGNEMQLPNTIQNTYNSNIHLYPNPSSKMIFIQNIEIGARVRIYDMNGKEVHSMMADNETIQINIEGLIEGIYQTIIENEEGLSLHKFVVNK